MTVELIEWRRESGHSQAVLRLITPWSAGLVANHAPDHNANGGPHDRQAHHFEQTQAHHVDCYRRHGNRACDRWLCDRRLGFEPEHQRGDGWEVIPFQRGAPSPATKVGQIPAGFTDGSGTLTRARRLNKAKAAAMAAYPGGTVDRVALLSDGEYNVHMIGVNWPYHVFVSQDFKVVGAE